MKPLLLCCVTCWTFAAWSAAQAADAAAGRRLAQERCAACHIVGPNGPDDMISDAPPFEMIGREFSPDWDMLAFNLMGPHQRMNFGLSRRDAGNITEYIRALVE